MDRLRVTPIDIKDLPKDIARYIFERIDGLMVPLPPSNLITGEWYLKISTDKWQALKKELNAD